MAIDLREFENHARSLKVSGLIIERTDGKLKRYSVNKDAKGFEVSPVAKTEPPKPVVVTPKTSAEDVKTKSDGKASKAPSDEKKDEVKQKDTPEPKKEDSTKSETRKPTESMSQDQKAPEAEKPPTGTAAFAPSVTIPDEAEEDESIMTEKEAEEDEKAEKAPIVETDEKEADSISTKIRKHLVRYSNQKSQGTLSPDVTQTGIAKKIGVDRAKVATVLKRMEGRKEVEKSEELRHVRGAKRMLHVYFLTPLGEQMAREEMEKE
jgi:DNA-binding MarR family transcriptional regulator